MCISFSKILSTLDNREIGLQLDTSSMESFLWKWITLAVFKIVGNIPVEKDKLHIVARCLDIWSWTRCKILVGILLGPQDLLMLRDDITLQISSLFVAVIMKESLLFVDKKLLKDLFENLTFDWTVSAIDVNLQLRLGHWCIFCHFWLWMLWHCFYVS